MEENRTYIKIVTKGQLQDIKKEITQQKGLSELVIHQGKKKVVGRGFPKIKVKNIFIDILDLYGPFQHDVLTFSMSSDSHENNISRQQAEAAWSYF